ncbi:MAG: PaaI family thioesterase [Thermodesulfobacteriota bacterium]
MKKLNPEWVGAVSTAVNGCPYFRLESMTVKDLKLGESLLEIEVGEKHLQPFGMVHGGVFSGLIDAAGFWAAFTDLDEGQSLTTLEMKLNYLAPSNGGRLIAHGRLIKAGRTISLADAYIENEEGRLLAHGLVTLMTIPDLKIKGSEGAPPKFLD